MIRSSDNWTPAEHVSGPDAVARYEAARTDADTVEVTCSYTGGQTVRAVWAATADLCFAYLHDSARPADFASCAPLDADRLYQAMLSNLVMRQAFVNSDPRSPDHFSPDRDLDIVAGEINDRFGTAVEAVM